MALMSFSSVASVCTYRPSEPAPLISANTASLSFSLRAATTTFAPSFAKAIVVARPMPALPPVTRATLPENCFVTFVSLATVELEPFGGPGRRLPAQPGSSNKWVARGTISSRQIDDLEPALTRHGYDVRVVVIARKLTYGNSVAIPAIAKTKNMRRYRKDSWLTTQSAANPSRRQIAGNR